MWGFGLDFFIWLMGSVFSANSHSHELKNVNAPELRTQVDLLLYQALPQVDFLLV